MGQGSDPSRGCLPRGINWLLGWKMGTSWRCWSSPRLGTGWVGNAL